MKTALTLAALAAALVLPPADVARTHPHSQLVATAAPCQMHEPLSTQPGAAQHYDARCGGWVHGLADAHPDTTNA